MRYEYYSSSLLVVVLQASQDHSALALVVIAARHPLLIEQVVTSGRIVHLVCLHAVNQESARVSYVLLNLLHKVIVYRDIIIQEGITDLEILVIVNYCGEESGRRLPLEEGLKLLKLGRGGLGGWQLLSDDHLKLGILVAFMV